MVPQTEQQARRTIDILLAQAGWTVCDASQANIYASRGIAIREFSPNSGCGFAQKISYHATSAKPKDCISELRVSPTPSIAVTVGEAETGEHPVNVRPTERARHGRRALDFRAGRDARAKNERPTVRLECISFGRAPRIVVNQRKNKTDRTLELSYAA